MRGNDLMQSSHITPNGSGGYDLSPGATLVVVAEIAYSPGEPTPSAAQGRQKARRFVTDMLDAIGRHAPGKDRERLEKRLRQQKGGVETAGLAIRCCSTVPTATLREIFARADLL